MRMTSRWMRILEVSVLFDLMAHEIPIEEKQFKNKKIEKKQLRKVGWKGE